MTIDEARNDIRRTEKAIQRMLEELQVRIGSSIEDVSVSLGKSQTFESGRSSSYIGRVKIMASL